MRGGRRKTNPEFQVLEGKRKPEDNKMPRPSPARNNDFVTPRWLPKRAKNFVNRYKKPLIDANVLTSWDWDTFLTMALLSAEIYDHYEVLEREGFTVEGRQKGIVKHPRVSMLRAATQQFRLYAESFGLTPRGRGALDIKPLDKPKSKMAELCDW
jgi:P27 family predicted phage terminase small subunit